MKFELCVDSYKEVMEADNYDFARVELCSALEVGGLTPSYGLVKEAAKFNNLEVHSMIRTRPGGFVYSDNELIIMKEDIKVSHDMGAKGVVFGVLDENNRIDKERNYLLIDIAKRFDLEITFHRAFDLVDDYEKALQDLIDMGFDRVLTSGGAESAIKGLENLKKYKEIAGEDLQVMAGGGINTSNAKQLAAANIDAIHFTARKDKKSASKLNIGHEFDVDTDKIKSILDLF